MKKCLTFFLIQFLALSSYAQSDDSLLKILVRNLSKEGKYDFIDDERDEGGRIVVRIGRKYGMLDRYYREIAPCIYDGWLQFSDGLAKVKVSDSVGLIDTNGNIVLQCRYKSIGVDPHLPINRDSSIVVNDFNKCGRVDRRGNIITPLIYDGLNVLTDKYIEVSINGLSGIINDSNDVIVPLSYISIRPFLGGNYFFVRTGENLCGIIDERNKVVVPIEYEDIDVPQTNTYFIPMQKGFAWGVVDIRNNKTVVPFVYERLDATDFHGFFRAHAAGKEGIIDSANRKVLSNKYHNIKMLMPGFFAVGDGLGRNVLNSREEKILDNRLLSLTMNDEYLIISELGDRYQVIEINGNQITPLELDRPFKLVDGRINFEPLPWDTTTKSTGRFYDIKHNKFIRVFPEKGKYKEVASFHEGIAVVIDADGYLGYINKEGKEIAPCIFQEAGIFSDGRALVSIDNRDGYIDKTGRLVIDTAYFDGETFSNGLARIHTQSGVGYILPDGTKKILPVFEGGRDFRDGRATVMKAGKWGVINKVGKTIIPFIYNDQVVFTEGLAPVIRDGQAMYIDTLGKTRISIPDSITDRGWFSDGMARVASTEKCGFIDKKGRMAIKPQFEYCTYFTKGVAGYMVSKETEYKTDERYGLIDKTGKRITPPLYREIFFSPKSDLIVVSGTYGYGIINRQGKIVAPCVYEKILPDHTGSGLFAANLAGKWGFINKLGKVAIPHRFDKALSFSEGLAAVLKDGRWGYIDVKGKSVLQFK
ncbi:MAG: WG repeat-containing protein [Taibaiella sp.]|nr:WG repeat-containing protein [Taibaiella sp.]